MSTNYKNTVNDIESYRELNDKVFGEYRWLYKEYPNISACIDLKLRLRVLGLEAFDKYSKPSPKIRAWIKLIISLMRLFLSSKKGGSYIYIPRFEVWFNRQILNIAAGSQAKKYILEKDCWLFRIVSSLPVVASLDKSVEKINQFREFPAPLMQQEASVLRAVSFISLILRYKKIEHIVLQEDVSIPASLIVLAAKKNSIKTTVICHGFIQSKEYLGILPLKSDFLCLWTEYERNKMCSGSFENIEPKRLKVGVPILEGGDKTEDLKRITVYDKTLFILEPLSEYARKNKTKELEGDLEKIKNIFPVVKLRYHPRDVIDGNFGLKGDFEVDQADFAEVASSYQLFILTNSSIAIELFISKRNVVQLEEYAISDFPGVPRVSVSEIENIQFDKINAKVAEQRKGVKHKILSLEDIIDEYN